MADKLIATTPDGDRLFQTGATRNRAQIGDLSGRVSPLTDDDVFAFGYVRYANGREFAIPYLQDFLAKGFFEQVAEIDETITD